MLCLLHWLSRLFSKRSIQLLLWWRGSANTVSRPTTVFKDGRQVSPSEVRPQRPLISFHPGGWLHYKSQTRTSPCSLLGHGTQCFLSFLVVLITMMFLISLTSPEQDGSARIQRYFGFLVTWHLYTQSADDDRAGCRDNTSRAERDQWRLWYKGKAVLCVCVV